MPTFTGFSSNGLPYARLSDKGPALVIFTGSELEHVPPTKNDPTRVSRRLETADAAIRRLPDESQTQPSARLFSQGYER